MLDLDSVYRGVLSPIRWQELSNQEKRWWFRRAVLRNLGDLDSSAMMEDRPLASEDVLAAQEVIRSRGLWAQYRTVLDVHLGGSGLGAVWYDGPAAVDRRNACATPAQQVYAAVMTCRINRRHGHRF